MSSAASNSIAVRCCLLQEDEEDGEDEAAECYEVVPLERLAFEEDSYQDSEDRKRDDFLDNFELHQVERSAVTIESDTVGGDLCAVFEKRHAPRKQDYQNQWPSGGNLHFLKFQMSVPGKCHKNI